MDDLDFDSDAFADIVAKDTRYDARAYTLLMDVIHYLGKEAEGGHMSAEDILDEFRCRTLDLYGPLSYTVLTEWGLKSCADIGEMMSNLVESRRVGRDEGDTPESFHGGYDFKEVFLGPFAA